MILIVGKDRIIKRAYLPGGILDLFPEVNTDVGTFGTASEAGSFTVNEQGQITAAENIPIQISESQVTNLTTDLAALSDTTATVSTTNATVTTIATIPIPSNTTVLIEGKVVARRTSGVAGSAQDGAGYIIAGTFKNISGTATDIGTSSIYSAEDQAAWSVGFNKSGGNALVQVTGATDNNIDWKIYYKLYTIS